jgi:alpha-beta hydrolase superfamily lysophospholipase
MLEGSVNAWLNDTVQSFEIGKRLGKKVIMIGVSTGGTAVTWLAAQVNTEGLNACILISPNFAPTNRTAGILTWPWGKQIAELASGKWRRWEAANPAHDRYWTNHYPTAALLPMAGMVKLAASLQLEKLKLPVLIIYSPKDRVVSPRATQKAFAAFGSDSKKILPFTHSQDPDQHVLAGDILSSDTTAQMADIIYEFIAGN